MKTTGFRYEDSTMAKLLELFAFYGVNGDGFSEQMRFFIDELHKKLLLYKNSQTTSEQPSKQKPSDDELTCKLRIPLKDSPCGYACVNCPPRIVKLATLEICRVCKALFLNLPTKTKRLAEEIEKAQTTPEPQEITQPQAAQPPKTFKDRPQTTKHYDTTYCPNGGFYVSLEKCPECKTRSFNVYDACRKYKVAHPR